LLEDLLLDLAIHRNLFEQYDIVHSVALVRMILMHVPLGNGVEIAFENTHAEKITIFHAVVNELWQSHHDL
jgi:hypothetical protein